MTWIELYDRVVANIWGISPAPQGAQAVLQGQYGLIANTHRKIQEEFNYWFMEDSDTITMVSGTSSYALPTNFKELIKKGFRFQDITTGDYYRPLSPLLPGEASDDYRGASDSADYPLYYEIYGGNVVLYPAPGLDNAILNMRYYGFMNRPPAVFDATFDALTRNGYNAITALATSEMCKINEEYQKQQAFQQDAVVAIELLHQLDDRMRRAEVTECKYRGF